MIRKFDNLHSPLARYDFEGNILDSSGNGLHLSGSAVFRALYENAIGLSGSLCNRGGISDPALRVTGDITVNALVVMRAAPTGLYVAAFQAPGETTAANFLWSLQIASQNQLAFLSEHDAPPTLAINDAFFSNAAPLGLPAFGVPFLLSMRRKAGVVSYAVQGVPYGDPSPVLLTPNGGTAAQLTINDPGSGAVDLLGLEIIGSALTDAQIKARYNLTLGPAFGELVERVQSLWVGALTDSSAAVMVRLSYAADAVRLAIHGPLGTRYEPAVNLAHGQAARFDLTGLDADTEYTYEVQSNGVTLEGPTGRFRTAPSGASSFLVAFSGDAVTGSNHVVFDTIRGLDPLLFLHLGDAHYRNISTNDPKAFQAAFDDILAQPRQAQLYREIPTAYVWDDHDFGGNNCDGSSASKPAAAATYRARVPHYPLPDATGIYQTFDIGRVRFIITDQRSAASPDSASDNASKSLLGTAQKIWFKNLLSSSSGKLIVWICPRWFGTPPTAGADSWGGFSTERAELVSHIHAQCPGRVLVLSADLHALGIDSGANHDFLPGGGEPLPTFQASPLDIAVPGGAGTYDHGGPYTSNGQFGTMQISDSGGSTIGVDWVGRDSTGAAIASHSFTVNL